MWHPVVARNSRGLPLISYISPSEDDLRKQALQVNLAVHVWFCLFLLFSIFFPAQTMWKDKKQCTWRGQLCHAGPVNAVLSWSPGITACAEEL